jgi:hypothetical protein
MGVSELTRSNVGTDWDKLKAGCNVGSERITAYRIRWVGHSHRLYMFLCSCVLFFSLRIVCRLCHQRPYSVRVSDTLDFAL